MNWIYIYRHSIDEVYKNADFSKRYIFEEDALDAGECMMSTEIFLHKTETINMIIMHSPDSCYMKYYYCVYFENIFSISDVIYNILDSLHKLPNTIYFDYISHICKTNKNTLEFYPLEKEALSSIIERYLENEVSLEYKTSDIIQNFYPGHLCEYQKFVNIKQMTTVNLTFKTIYDWYNINQTNTQYFTPSQNIQYRYIAKVNNQWRMSNNIGNVSLRFDYMNTPKNIVLYSTIFGTLSHNGMYLQMTPDDIYLVVPTILQNIVYGNHYRIHFVQQFTPDYDRSLIMSNVIDVHRTRFSNNYSKHDPKCVISDGISIPIKDYQLDLNSVICYNKKPGTGFDIFKNIFAVTEEKQFFENLLSLPYNIDCKREKAANTIIKAWRKFKGQGGKIIKYGKRGGLYENDMYVKKTYKDYNATISDIESVYVIMIKHEDMWHYTVNMYSKNDPIIFNVKNNIINDKFIIDNLNAYLSSSHGLNSQKL